MAVPTAGGRIIFTRVAGGRAGMGNNAGAGRRPTLGGYGLHTVSLTRLPAATANLIATLEPATTVGLAFVLLGERLTGPQLLGGSLVLTGVVLLRLSDRAMQAARVPPPPSPSRSP